MALFGLFSSSDKDMAAGRYAGRESATERAERKETEARASRAASHRRSATRIDRKVAAQEDANRRDERTGHRGRNWW